MGGSLTTSLEELQRRLEHQYANEELLRRALTHKSFYHENESESPGHNETLEFLGDAVLGLVVAELLMRAFPQDDEGDLSRKRALLVKESGLAELAADLELRSFLRLGKGEVLTGGAEKPRILAAAFEALIGSLYLDAGFEICRATIKRFFTTAIGELASGDRLDQD